MSEPFWANDTRYLFNSFQFIPCNTCTSNENYNRLTRLVLFTSVLISILKRTTKGLYIGIFFMAIIGFLYFITLNKMTEPFENNTMFQNSLLFEPNNSTAINYSGNMNIGSPYQYSDLNYGIGPQLYRVATEYNGSELRNPTSENPFMNVMPLDYSAKPIFEDYLRYENYDKKDFKEVDDKINSEFERNLFQNASDRLWNRANSQRQFISQPVGSVPSNQAEFANWLYSPNEGVVCKSGSIWDKYGVQFTDDSLVCNGFNAATPTNKGLLNGNLMSSVASNN